MIKAVQDWFEDELISTKSREHFNTEYEHRLIIKLPFIKALMYNTFADEFETHHGKGWESVVLVPGGGPLADVLWASIDKEVDNYYKLSTVKKRVYQEQSKIDWEGNTQDVGVRVNGSSGKFIIKGSQPGGKGSDIILDFDVGIITKRTGRVKVVPMSGGRTSKTKVIIMSALRQMFGICAITKVFQGDIKKQLNVAVNRVRNQMKKTHGETLEMEEDGVYQADPSKFEGGKSPATIAILDLAKNWNQIGNKVKAKGLKTAGGVLVDQNVLDETVKEIQDALQLEYGIEDFLDANTGEVRRDILIAMELNGPQSSMKKYDVDGIKAYLQSVRQDIMNKLLKSGRLKDIADLEGSDSPLTHVKRQAKKQVIVDMLGGLKKANPDLRLKVNKQLAKEAQKALKPVKRKNSIGGVIGKAGTVKAASSRARRTSKKSSRKTEERSVQQAQTQISPIALRTLLNEALPMQVAKNMGSPALNYRTGRFANSARVEHAARGQRGGLHIDYTYMRDPYETFEPGNKQGSTFRDPKKIIGKSIRELAIGLLGKNPTTLRRV